MRQYLRLIGRLTRDDGAATAIEYAIIASAIFFAIVTTVQLAGAELGTIFQALVDGFIAVQS